MNKIKLIRESKGLTRTDLAKLSGVPYRTITNWELGIRKIKDVYQIKKVAEALETTIENLI